MIESKNHIIFIATGEPDKNGNLYSKDLKIQFNETVPITLGYDDSKVVGIARNIKFEHQALIADLFLETSTGINKTPGICFSVDSPVMDKNLSFEENWAKPIKGAKLLSIGMITKNVDDDIKGVI